MCIRDSVITVCNSANKEVCPVWPNNNQIIHWDIDDPVSKFQNSNEKQINEIISETYDIISKKIKILLENEN